MELAQGGLLPTGLPLSFVECLGDKCGGRGQAGGRPLPQQDGKLRSEGDQARPPAEGRPPAVERVLRIGY